ncbi:hypothetical protein GOD70_27085 [Sinorhizobium medicae]|uniref:hypothetical protein n=1 Tax=Sinorhizobium medicae TaxID=110321 RepID=UPI0011A5986C|nr:hypothetical protein [Sinorhizobium medicae]MDX0790123.1 hypothetical protein [Sinorhizobium medicae]MDX0973704.1 hypothetical protein [Sinorhizobium medicae]TWA45859.1 hypothetical protein FB008_1278 [Sinorhizobium medicae]
MESGTANPALKTIKLLHHVSPKVVVMSLLLKGVYEGTHALEKMLRPENPRKLGASFFPNH